MEYIVIILASITFLVILAFILELNINKLKSIGENKQLDELTNSFPENIDVCKSILKMLGNENVRVTEEKDSKTSLYVVANNSITIANIRNSYTRIQTIAHECIHSMQSKKMLWFNFIYTNIYMLYFLLIIVLTAVKVISAPYIFLAILIIMSLIQYFVRSGLETEAMIKARYVAKDYLEQNNICTKVEIEKIVKEYDRLNNIGIKFVNFDILARNFIKVIIYCVICLAV